MTRASTTWRWPSALAAHLRRRNPVGGGGSTTGALVVAGEMENGFNADSCPALAMTTGNLTDLFLIVLQ